MNYILCIYGVYILVLLLDSIPRQGSQQDILERLERLNVDDYDTLTQIAGPEHDIVLSRIISENMVCGILPN
jgi:hypothetical protein